LFAPCEVAVKTVSPAIRALLAKKLLEKHDLKETQVAEILGVTQSAVSKYHKNVRGTTIPIENIPEIQTIANQMIVLLLKSPTQQAELIDLFCRACSIIRNKGLMCGLCQQNQKVKTDNCDFCHTP
jgi:hypothetical protein